MSTPLLDKILKEAKERETQPQYHLIMKFNDMVFECDTNDIEEAMMSFKPSFFKTRVIVIVKKGDLYCDRIMFVKRAKQVFRNKLAMKVFVSKLIFKQQHD